MLMPWLILQLWGNLLQRVVSSFASAQVWICFVCLVGLLTNISEDIPKMPRSWSGALSRHQKEKRWGRNKDKANATYGTTDAQRRTATDQPPWNGQVENYWETYLLYSHKSLPLSPDAATNIKPRIQTENRKQSGQPLKKMTTMLSPQENKANGKTYSSKGVQHQNIRLWTDNIIKKDRVMEP